MGYPVSLVDGHVDEPKKRTNYEKIKNMSIEEMTKFLCDLGVCVCCDCLLNNSCQGECEQGHRSWLEREAEE